MKLTAINTSRQEQPNFSYLLRLATTLESAYGAGAMTSDSNRKAHEARGWTTAQLLAMSKSKLFFN